MLEMERHVVPKIGLLFLSVFVLLCVNISYSEDINSNSHFDMMAQSYCASMESGWVFALRRTNCLSAPTCEDMCKNAEQDILSYIRNQRKYVRCFAAFRVGTSRPNSIPSETEPYTGIVSLPTHGYGYRGCSWRANHCGPNYCCCKAHKTMMTLSMMLHK